jgi:hypothetical protein
VGLIPEGISIKAKYPLYCDETEDNGFHLDLNELSKSAPTALIDQGESSHRSITRSSSSKGFSTNGKGFGRAFKRSSKSFDVASDTSNASDTSDAADFQIATIQRHNKKGSLTVLFEDGVEADVSITNCQNLSLVEGDGLDPSQRQFRRLVAAGNLASVQVILIGLAKNQRSSMNAPDPVSGLQV